MIWQERNRQTRCDAIASWPASAPTLRRRRRPLPNCRGTAMRTFVPLCPGPGYLGLSPKVELKLLRVALRDVAEGVPQPRRCGGPSRWDRPRPRCCPTFCASWTGWTVRIGAGGACSEPWRRWAQPRRRPWRPCGRRTALLAHEDVAAVLHIGQSSVVEEAQREVALGDVDADEALVERGEVINANCSIRLSQARKNSSLVMPMRSTVRRCASGGRGRSPIVISVPSVQYPIP